MTLVTVLLLCFLGLHSEEGMKIGNIETGITLTNVLKLVNFRKGEA